MHKVRSLAAELAEARDILARVATADLIILLQASPPVAYWSTILAELIRGELHRREFDCR